METPNETPLDALLPAEVVAKIREAIAQGLSQQAPPQAPRRAPILEGDTFRPMAEGFVQTSAVVTPQYILQALLNDPATSTKVWTSPLALVIIPIIAQILIIFYQEYREDMRNVDNARFMQTLVQQVEQFCVDHTDQPQPTPQSTPNDLNPPPPPFSLGSGH